MKNTFAHTLVTGLSLIAALNSFAGHQVEKSPKTVLEPEPTRTLFPDDPAGLITAGVQFSEHLTGVYVDSITGLWTTPERDAFLFLDSLYQYEDNGQFVSSTGLAFRKLLSEAGVIVGANVFWDSISSARDNDYDQLGLGVEVLSRWVDFRFNYYLPEDDQYVVARSSRTQSSEFRSGGSVVERTRTRGFKRYEAALEGFNSELGFLVPGLDRYAEVRLFGGYYHYANPFGGDFNGFKARLEARLLPGVIADVEYWDDSALMGGHWTAGMRVSVPFSLFNLVKGRNPFEGAGDFFTPRSREFGERLEEMIIRSHRIKT
ncbi:MAG: hypothetical protein EOP84_35885, partial [Verrucomicrobiaceae bacterium]